MDVKISQPYFLLGLIVALFALVFFIFRPFLIALVLAAIFATVLHPLYEGICRRANFSPGLSAFATIMIALVCILGPLSFVAVRIANDAQNLYVSLSDGSSRAYIDTIFSFVNSAVATYAPHLSLSAADLSTSFDQYIKDGLQWIIQNIGSAFGSVARFLATLFLFFIALYYLLRDGDSIKKTIVLVSPLADSDDNTVFSQLKLSVQSVVRGSLVIALIQGVLTGIGFSIFGVPNSFLWGVVAAFSALIPGVGTSLILIPGIAYLIIVGATASAVGLIIWSVIAVGLIDNLLGPHLIGSGMQLHPLLVFLSVFGGLIFFGPVGVILGPLCTSTLFTFLSIYQNIRRQSV